MTTLMAVYDNNGCRGRCDARCYNARTPECECVCGGINHGVGLEKAVDNTQRMAEAMIEAFARKNGLGDYRAEVAPIQLSLF